jgi:CheY-like chemotaxis protein
MNHNLLLVEDNEDYSKALKRILIDENYRVFSASTIIQARKILREQTIDLVILDQKLNKDDPSDQSGLEIAKDRSFQHIPKIVFTEYDLDPKELHLLMDLEPGELPNVIQFLSKTEGHQILLDVIRKSLRNWPKITQMSNQVSRQIEMDYQDTKRQAKYNFIITSVVSIIGLLTLFTGIGLAWNGLITIGIVGSASGIMLEVLGYLFYRQLEASNLRMDRYHREQLQTYWFELLFAAAEQLPAEQQMKTMKKIILKSSDSWFKSIENVQTKFAAVKEAEQGIGVQYE